MTAVSRERQSVGGRRHQPPRQSSSGRNGRSVSSPHLVGRRATARSRRSPLRWPDRPPPVPRPTAPALSRPSLVEHATLGPARVLQPLSCATGLKRRRRAGYGNDQAGRGRAGALARDHDLPVVPFWIGLQEGPQAPKARILLGRRTVRRICLASLPDAGNPILTWCPVGPIHVYGPRPGRPVVHRLRCELFEFVLLAFPDTPARDRSVHRSPPCLCLGCPSIETVGRQLIVIRPGSSRATARLPRPDPTPPRAPDSARSPSAGARTHGGGRPWKATATSASPGH